MLLPITIVILASLVQFSASLALSLPQGLSNRVSDGGNPHKRRAVAGQGPVFTGVLHTRDIDVVLRPKAAGPRLSKRGTSASPPYNNDVFTAIAGRFMFTAKVKFGTQGDSLYDMPFDTSLSPIVVFTEGFAEQVAGTFPEYPAIDSYNTMAATLNSETTGRDVPVDLSKTTKFTCYGYLDKFTLAQKSSASAVSVLVAYEGVVTQPVDGFFGVAPNSAAFTSGFLQGESVLALDLHGFGKRGGSFQLGGVSNFYGALIDIPVVGRKANPTLRTISLVKSEEFELFAMENGHLTVDGHTHPTTTFDVIINTNTALTFIPWPLFARHFLRQYGAAHTRDPDPSRRLWYVKCSLRSDPTKKVSFEMGSTGASFRFSGHHSLIMGPVDGLPGQCIFGIQSWAQDYVALGSNVLINNYLALYFVHGAQKPRVSVANKRLGHAVPP